MELHNGINDEEYSHRIDYLRKILIKELEGREEGYSDGNQLIVGCRPESTLSHIKDKS